MSTSPFRVTADITGEQQEALDRLSRRTGRSRNSHIRAAIDTYLASLEPVSPAEAALSSEPVAPPSAAHGESVASASEQPKKRRPSTRWCSPPTHALRSKE